jgi:stage II sporulation protein AA (anti-sigma F factor antagonist)
MSGKVEGSFMALILNSKKNTLIAHISGDFDLVKANQYREQIDRNLAETMSQNLLLDLAKTTFIDSSGLGVIMGRYRKVKANHGQMIIYGVSPRIRKIFELSGILSLMPVCSSEEAAWKILEENTRKEA